ncbi:MAG: GlsB/YeaQ/YmgE family stress response membrane protein [Steroidobacteraceae bacterium]
MGIISAIVVGFIVGIIAKFFVHGTAEPRGFIWTVIIGIAGSFLATWVGRSVGWYQGGRSAGWIASIIGAIVLLLIYGAIVRNRRAAART